MPRTALIKPNCLDITKLLMLVRRESLFQRRLTWPPVTGSLLGKLLANTLECRLAENSNVARLESLDREDSKLCNSTYMIKSRIRDHGRRSLFIAWPGNFGSYESWRRMAI